MTQEIKQKPSGWMGTYWIPIAIGLLLCIIFVNYLLIPFLGIFFPVKSIVLPAQFWNLIMVTIPAHMGIKVVDNHLPGIVDKFSSKPPAE